MRRFTALFVLFVPTAASLLAQPAVGDLQFGNPAAAQLPAWEPIPPVSAAPTPEQTFPVPLSSSPPFQSAPPSSNVDPRSTIVAPALVSDSIYRNRAWRADIGILPGAVLYLTDGAFASWPHEPLAGIRFTAGYENDTGWGTRFRLSALGQDGTVNGWHTETIVGSVSVDFYKRLFLESTEVVLGAGVASGFVSFAISQNVKSEFDGGGPTAFAELWHPMLRLQRWDIGFAGRARLSITQGPWHNANGGGLISETNRDTMTLSEIAWGLEVRRRFGALQDHYWYLMLLADTQNFNSPWLTTHSGTSLSFSGLNLTAGIAY